MRPALEVADVFREGASRFLAGQRISRQQRRVLQAIMRCRTAALGGHVYRCQDCGHEKIQYNSCRDRHCPKCQAMARAAWLSERESELLPVSYFHLVFTIPHQLAPLALQNPRVVYGILFRAAAETLRQLAADPKHLGAEIGCLMVLHTWGQNLMHHPHVHAIVTGGGPSADRSRWVSCRRAGRRDFFLPVRVLSRVYRGKFLALLKQAFGSGQLQFAGSLSALRSATAFQRLLGESVRREWVVYAKRPFGGPQQVLKYLARYTHRVAISNRRLIALRDGRVTFSYQDYADGRKIKAMTLDSVEFIRRFLLHVLPAGFVRIRYYGFLANRDRQQHLAECRRLLGVDGQEPLSPEPPSAPQEEELPPAAAGVCPQCQRGVLTVVQILPPNPPLPPRRPQLLARRAALSGPFDTS
jgi:hypothetical protein